MWNGSVVGSDDGGNEIGSAVADSARNPSFTPVSEERQPQRRGLRYESFVLLESSSMMDFRGGY